MSVAPDVLQKDDYQSLIQKMTSRINLLSAPLAKEIKIALVDKVGAGDEPPVYKAFLELALERFYQNLRRVESNLAISLSLRGDSLRLATNFEEGDPELNDAYLLMEVMRIFPLICKRGEGSLHNYGSFAVEPHEGLVETATHWVVRTSLMMMREGEGSASWAKGEALFSNFLETIYMITAGGYKGFRYTNETPETRTSLGETLQYQTFRSTAAGLLTGFFDSLGISHPINERSWLPVDEAPFEALSKRLAAFSCDLGVININTKGADAPCITCRFPSDTAHVYADFEAQLSPYLDKESLQQQNDMADQLDPYIDVLIYRFMKGFLTPSDSNEEPVVKPATDDLLWAFASRLYNRNTTSDVALKSALEHALFNGKKQVFKIADGDEEVPASAKKADPSPSAFIL